MERALVLHASVFAATVAGALVLAGPAFAHVTVTPARIEAGERTLTFTVPNEFGGASTPARIAEVTIEAPPGVRVGSAQAKAGWTTAIRGRKAIWSRGAIPYRSYDTFGLDVEVPDAGSDLVFRATESFSVPRHHIERYPVPVAIGATRSTKSGHGLAVAALLVALTAAGIAAASLFFALAHWLRGA